ncbi:MAG: hypothetical protein JSV40_00520 [Deltaproteobacteria bacterium]|nr:MAG: hypothetical protein JSV40_00520 [Deltaproteobacteria bacterium]
MRLRHVIISLVVWVVVVCIAYIITSVRTNHAKARIKDSGIETIQALSKLVSLPLLDSNAQTINAMLIYAARETPMVHAAVLDHQEKIVTFAGAEKAIPAPNPDEHPGKDTAFWEAELPDHKKILGFASDVTYSGTTIGRIQIALPAQELVTIRNQFLIVAVLACVILLLVIILFRYYPGIWATPIRLTNVYRRDTVSDPALESSVVTCPLCGARNSFSTKLFKRSNFGRLLIIRPSSNRSGPGGDADLKGMRLSDLAKRDELSWLKRQIVLRCAEIIKKLAG